MYCKKGDIVQFVLSNPDDLDRTEVPFTFGLSSRNILEYDSSVRIKTYNNLGIYRDFHRFNVISSDCTKVNDLIKIDRSQF